MTLFILFLQVLLPLALLAWLAFRPLPSRAGALLQAAATGLFLWVLARGAMWTVPPLWTPWLYGKAPRASRVPRFATQDGGIRCPRGRLRAGATA